jgi:hypothetical protein
MGYTDPSGSYVSFGLWLNGEAYHFKLSRGGAEVLSTEIAGALAMPLPPVPETLCLICGQPERHHDGPMKFCRMYATYRPALTSNNRGSEHE